MSTAFEQFVDDNLPLKVGLSATPAGGNATAKNIPYFTGTGLVVSQTVTHGRGKNCYFVSPNDPMADYSDLGAAITAACQAANALSLPRAWTIFLDPNHEIAYTIIDLVLSGFGSTQPIINITPYGGVPRQPLSDSDLLSDMPSIVLQNSDYGIHLDGAILNFHHCRVIVGNTSANHQDFIGFDMYDHCALTFDHCYLIFLSFSAGFTCKFVKGHTGGARVDIVDCFINATVLAAKGIVGYTHIVFDFSSTYHPQLYLYNSKIISSESVSLGTENVVLFNIETTQADYLVQFTAINNIYQHYIKEASSGNRTFLKSNISTSFSKQNLILNNAIAVGTFSNGPTTASFTFLDYDSNTNDGAVYAKNNFFTNILSVIPSMLIYKHAAGDSIYADGDKLVGTITANSGAGTYIDIVHHDQVQLLSGAAINEFSIDGTLAGNSDTSVPTEQAVKTYVDKDSYSAASTVYWSGTPTTIKTALDRLAAIAYSLSGNVPIP